jgi:simple sugar transport system ATP-binding protein
MAEDLLSLRNTSKSYAGVKALSRVELSVRRGEIHCVVGENGSGKSTLMKIIAGVVTADPGSEISIDGRSYRRLSPLESVKAGIQVIYQDLSLFPNLTVTENVSLNQYLEERRFLANRGDFIRVARAAMDRIGAHIDVSLRVGELPIAKQQLVAICRALTRGGRLLIMDEPTSSLGRRDVDFLFSTVRKLKEQGVAVVFVGHKLNEVFEIADRVTVLRDGVRIGTHPISDITQRRLVELMTGRDIGTSSCVEHDHAGEEPILAVGNLSRKGQFADISFSLYPGEILAIAGTVGSGRTELALSLFGLNPADSGTIATRRLLPKNHTVLQAMEAGIGYVPEDRLTQGLFMEHSIGRNMIVTVLASLLNRLGLLDEGKIRKVNDEWIRNLSIKTPSAELAVKQLSGGNQQRVVLSKWLQRSPSVLILDGPTIGVDVGAKEEIHAVVRGLADGGMGIIMISDEAAEIVQHSDRILIMKEGRLVGECATSGITESGLLERMA